LAFKDLISLYEGSSHLQAVHYLDIPVLYARLLMYFLKLSLEQKRKSFC
jgi:hypothetical protein